MKTDSEFNSKKIQNEPKFEKAIERQFFERVYSKPISVYQNRLSRISLNNKSLVLDAGCGFGQWTIALSRLNKDVIGMDIDISKLKIAMLKAKEETNDNIEFEIASSENLPFKDEKFNAIICYSVIYRTDFQKSLREFYRVLKPKGIVYIVTNGIGWYLYNLLTGHSSAKDFNARKHAIQTIFRSFRYKLTKKTNRFEGDLIIPPESFLNEMRSIGFKNVVMGPEGHIKIDNNSEFSFYPKKFLGLTNVYEVLAEK